jgi:HEAT repeat protein
VVETDKVDRLLGDKTAGFSHAKEWMTSPDESLRMKAVWVFKDIGDADSQAALKILATDKDPGVAMEASAYLQKLEQK